MYLLKYDDLKYLKPLKTCVVKPNVKTWNVKPNVKTWNVKPNVKTWNVLQNNVCCGDLSY